MLDPSEGYADPLVTRLVQLANVCQTWSKLPREGGVLDQDALTIIGMQYVLEAQEKKRELERDKKKPKGK